MGPFLGPTKMDDQFSGGGGGRRRRVVNILGDHGAIIRIPCSELKMRKGSYIDPDSGQKWSNCPTSGKFINFASSKHQNSAGIAIVEHFHKDICRN